MTNSIPMRTDFRGYVFGWRDNRPQQEKLLNGMRAAGIEARGICSYAKEIHGEINVGEETYFTGQWQAAVANFLESDAKYMVHFQADADLRGGDWNRMLSAAAECFGRYNCGIYAPEVYFTWHVKKEEPALQPGVFQVACNDCTAWILSREIVQWFHDHISLSGNRLGWGIDDGHARCAWFLNRPVIRDYRFQVDHPECTNYPYQEAADGLILLEAQFDKLGLRQHPNY